MKIVKVVNFEKLQYAIMGLGSNIDIAKKLKVVPSTVSNWISGNRIPTSNNILKLLEAYKDNITAEQLGVEIYDTENNVSFTSRLKELLHEKNLNQKDFSEGIGYSEGSISKWIKGTMPPLKTVIDIADYFDVSVLYMLCQTNIRNANNEDISEILQCTEYFLDFIKDDTRNSRRIFMGMQMTAEELGEDYFDLKDTVYSDVLLLSTLKAECDRIISYYTGKTYYNRFEETINQTDIISQSSEQPVRFEIEQLSHSNISTAISRAFDKYINIKLAEIYKRDERFKNMYSNTKNDKEVKEITDKIKANIEKYSMKK